MSVPAKKRFAQVYPQGWQTIRSLGENPTALRVYTFIAEHCDHLNALVCSLDVLAGAGGQRAHRPPGDALAGSHLVIAKIRTANAYILDPNDVWKNYERYKGYCGFHANTLASKSQNRLLKARLTHMLEGQGKLFSAEELPPEPPSGRGGLAKKSR